MTQFKARFRLPMTGEEARGGGGEQGVQEISSRLLVSVYMLSIAEVKQAYSIL